MEEVFQKFKELEGRFLTEEDVKELAEVIENSAGEYYFTKKVKKMNEVLDEIRRLYNIPEDSIFKFKFAFRGKRDKGTKGKWEVGEEYGGNIYKTRAAGGRHLDVIVWESSNKMIGMKLEKKGSRIMKRKLMKLSERLLNIAEGILKLAYSEDIWEKPAEDWSEQELADYWDSLKNWERYLILQRIFGPGKAKELMKLKIEEMPERYQEKVLEELRKKVREMQELPREKEKLFAEYKSKMDEIVEGFKEYIDITASDIFDKIKREGIPKSIEQEAYNYIKSRLEEEGKKVWTLMELD